MDKQDSYMESKQITKRPRWKTLCMMATAASVITLAGCGDNEEPPAPAEEPSPLEQGATTDPEPNMDAEPATQQNSGLEAESASEGSITQGSDADSEAPTSSQGMTDENMPEDTMDEPVEGENNTDEAGFGEGTEPMPGTEDEENSTSSQ